MEDTLLHYEYLADKVKLDRYRTAIDKLIRPDHVVLDLGCGTGVLGLMALQAGAARAHFVDNGPVIEVARQTLEDAGFGDRAQFYRGDSFALTLPERVDVVICDHVGYFGFDYGILEFLADARERFLKPDGQLVPGEITLELAPVESEDCRKIVARWSDGSIPGEFGWIGDTAANTKHDAQLKAGDVLSSAATLGVLTLGEDTPDYLSWEAKFECARDGTLDGVAGWFDCRLFEDVRMTNSPLEDGAMSRPQAFFPLSSPVQVKAGELVNVTIMVRPLDNVIGWVVELPASGQRYAQTTFNGIELDSDTLTRLSPDRLAGLNQRGRAYQVVLSYCDGTRTVAEIQALVEREHPELFPSHHAIRTFVRTVLEWNTSD